MLYQPKRIEAGKYRLGKYIIIRDPTGGRVGTIGGFTSWYIFDESDKEQNPIWFLGEFQWSTYRDASHVLLRHIANSDMNPLLSIPAFSTGTKP